MTRALKSFDELPLKVVAVDTIDNRDVALQVLASSPQARLLAAPPPLEQPLERQRVPLEETNAWLHGGINE